MLVTMYSKITHNYDICSVYKLKKDRANDILACYLANKILGEEANFREV